MITVIALSAVLLLVLLGAVWNVVAHDGGGHRRSAPASHHLDTDFVAPRDRMAA